MQDDESKRSGFSKVVHCEKPIYIGYPYEDEQVPRDTIFVVESGGKIQWVGFVCPGGCGAPIYLPAGDSERNSVGARWSCEVRDGKATLRPSVGSGKKKDGGFCCHYFIEENRVRWLD